MCLVFADRCRIHPATLALFASCCCNEILIFCRIGLCDCYAGYNQNLFEQLSIFRKNCISGIVCNGNFHRSFERLPNYLFIPLFFEHLVDIQTSLINQIPFFCECIVCNQTALFRQLVQENAFGVIGCTVRHKAPDFFCGEGEYRSEQQRHTTQNAVHGCLCSPSCNGGFLFTVQTILDDVQIEVGHIGCTEIVNAVEYHMEIKVGIPFMYLVNQSIQTNQCPAV